MNGMKEAYTARELSPILGLTERAVLYLAEREGWQSRPRAGRGSEPSAATAAYCLLFFGAFELYSDYK